MPSLWVQLPIPVHAIGRDHSRRCRRPELGHDPSRQPPDQRYIVLQVAASTEQEDVLRLVAADGAGWHGHCPDAEAGPSCPGCETVQRGERPCASTRHRHPVVPLVWALDKACDGDAGGYVHWGATTQNGTQTVEQTGRRGDRPPRDRMVGFVAMATNVGDAAAALVVAARWVAITEPEDRRWASAESPNDGELGHDDSSAPPPARDNVLRSYGIDQDDVLAT